jgi:rhodanese-related sulfurtransferase
MRRSIASLLAATLVLATVIAACGGGTGRVVSATEAVAMLDERTVIDVRSPAEYAEGHVAGALNIDVESPDFAERIAALDPDAPYLLYCRSGRRSAIAAETMAEAGFADLVDAQALEDLVTAGAPIE